MTRVRFTNQLVLLLGFSLVIYNEWLVYLLKANHWTDLPTLHPPGNNVRMLLVADPQLLGHVYENWAFGAIARWDSDRYLRVTFLLALQHVRPDVIVFLGDLLDEGSISDDEYFKESFERFEQVFPLPHKTKMVFIPGDNDVGGEGIDRLTPEKTHRFDSIFKDTIRGQYKFVEFIKVNYFAQTVDSVSSNRKMLDKTIRIVLSHAPLLPAPGGHFTSKIVESARPDIILSAHEHISVHVIGDRKSGKYKHQEQLMHESRLWYLPLDKGQIHEIMVPTCSYRMGVKNMGYGAAVIDKSGNIHYTVLWLPGRFSHLCLYVGFLILIALLVLSHICRTFCRAFCR